MEERRLLLAFALSFLVLVGYRLLVAPPPTSEPAPPAPPSPTVPRAEVAPSPPSPSPAARPAPTPVPVVADERERRIEVTGPESTLVFTNKGARLLSWRLTRFKDSQGRTEEMVQVAPGGPRPLDVQTGDAALDVRLKEALFRPSSEALTVPATGDAVLRFEYAEGDLSVEKSLGLRSGEGYLVGVSIVLRQGGRQRPVKVLWGPGVGNPSPAEMEVRGYQAPQVVALLPGGGGVERIPVQKLEKQPTVGYPVRWVGVEGTYFAALWVPPGGSGVADLEAIPMLPLEDGKPRQGPQVAFSLTPEAPEALLYVGPKDHAGLSKLGHDLARVVPVGEWLGPLVVPLMALLRWINSHVGNYGWSIILLTVLINVAMSPLRHYSIASGQKMAKIAPEMKVIQDRYRGLSALDKRREPMQKEIADLYARHGMSMGTQMTVGCLPILLTMPFLFAIYRVLQISIELRGAPFLWIADLSQKDPLFVTPLLMGASMFLMQRMTPTTMDPSQQQIMMIMPLVLVGTFLWAPAGLNLYWLASNVCSIIQQGVTLRILKAREAAAAKRRKK